MTEGPLGNPKNVKKLLLQCFLGAAVAYNVGTSADKDEISFRGGTRLFMNVFSLFFVALSGGKKVKKLDPQNSGEARALLLSRRCL